MREQFTEAWNKMIEKLELWFDALVTHLPNLILALVIFFLAFLVSIYINKLTLRILRRRPMKISLKKVIARLMAVIVIVVGLFMVLGILNLDKLLTTMLAGAGVAGLVMGLALQGALSNTFAGVALSFIKYVRIGDSITSNGYSGEIVDINLRATVLKEADNNLVAIPNKMVVENPLKNHSLTPTSRVILNCGVAYKSDLEFVKKLVIKTIEDNFDAVEDKEVIFLYTEFGENAINFETRFWINSRSELEVLKAKDKAIILIKKAFDKEGITIPFPVRTLDFLNKPEITKD